MKGLSARESINSCTFACGKRAEIENFRAEEYCKLRLILLKTIKIL